MNTDIESKLPIIVSGGSGKLGQLVLKNLLEKYRVPAEQIIVVSRTPENLTALSRKGVTVRKGDYDRPDLLPEAYAGGNRMLLISMMPESKAVADPIPANRKRPKQQNAAIDAAIEAGVKHIIYTSAPNPEPGTPCYWHEDHYETEKHLIGSGVNWTILRNGEFPGWHLEHDWIHGLETNEFYTSRGAGRMNHVLREDCAAAAAGALVSDISLNRRFELTGPVSLTAEEIIEILSDVSGKKIQVVHCSREDLKKRYEKMDVLNANFSEVLLDVNTAVKMGRFDGVTDSVEMLSGNKPGTLKEFLQKRLPEKALPT